MQGTRIGVAAFLLFAGFAIARDTLVRGFFDYPQIEVPLSVEVASSTESILPGEYPARLLIENIDVDALVEDAGIVAGSRMAAPQKFANVAWFKYGTVPGKKGAAVIGGHRDNGFGLDGAFRRLDTLAPGDDIVVVTKDGAALHFTVERTAVYSYTETLESLFATTTDARLNLITCTGRWIKVASHGGWTFDRRLVVYAVRKGGS